MWTKVVRSDKDKSADKAGLELLHTHSAWVRTVIASNPFANEEEILSFFVKNGFPEKETRQWIACYEQPFADY